MADSLTIVGGDQADTLRAVLRSGIYQLRSEHEALEARAKERERRKQVGAERQEKTISESKRRKMEADSRVGYVSLRSQCSAALGADLPPLS